MGELPEGQWKAALATRFDRTIYIYSVETTAVDDATLVAAFNAAPNKSRFNFFYRNCSDQAKSILDLILPHIDVIGDRTDGLTMHTPKGLAKALVARGLEHPELHLRVRRYPQIPGTFSRSRDVLFPMENTYKSIGFAPWWFFGGFREVALGTMFYHEVISPFGMLQSSRDFISPEAAELTLEQRRLRHRQDEIRQALAVAQSHNAGWSTLSELNVRIFQRLGEIEKAKRAEVGPPANGKRVESPPLLDHLHVFERRRHAPPAHIAVGDAAPRQSSAVQRDAPGASCRHAKELAGTTIEHPPRVLGRKTTRRP